jgi:hypothetical protein
MTVNEAVLVAETLDFEFDFGWRSGSPPRSQAGFQYRIPPLRRTGPRFKSARPDQIPDSRYFPAAEGFRTAVFRSSAAIMR